MPQTSFCGDRDQHWPPTPDFWSGEHTPLHIWREGNTCTMGTLVHRSNRKGARGGGGAKGQNESRAYGPHNTPLPRTTVKALEMTEATPPVVLTGALPARILRI